MRQRSLKRQRSGDGIGTKGWGGGGGNRGIVHLLEEETERRSCRAAYPTDLRNELIIIPQKISHQCNFACYGRYIMDAVLATTPLMGTVCDRFNLEPTLAARNGVTFPFFSVDPLLHLGP